MVTKILNWKYKVLAISALVLLGVFIYSNTFHSSFHFDDDFFIVKNPAIKDVSNLRAIFKFSPTRFMTFLSIAINYRLTQLNVFSYHIFNLTVHICSAVLVWWLMLLTLSAPAMKGKKIAEHANLIAFFVGFVFIAHPVQTQAVTYIFQRTASLATLLYLTSLSFYVKSRLLQLDGNRPIVSSTLYCCSLIVAVIAMFTKEIAVTLPLAVLLFEICFLKKDKKINWKYIIPFVAIIWIIPLTLFLNKSIHFTETRIVLRRDSGIPPWQYLCTQFRVIITYLRLLFIPVNQNLDYDYHVVKNLLELPALASLIILVLILAVAIRAYSKYRLISFGIFWFFLTLLPESSIIPIIDLINEHRLYLPMVGFSFFLVSAIYYIFQNKTLKSMIAVLLIITSFYAIASYRRNFVWKDELTLWDDTVRKSPNKARVYYNRGIAYGQNNNLPKAISDFTRAIELKPNFAEAYYNRGNAYGRQNNLPQAISDFTKAIELKPNFAEAYYRRGITFSRQGKLPQAISDFTKAIELKPSFARAYYKRSVSYYMAKEYDKAWADLHKAEELGSSVNSKFLEGLKKVSGRDR